MAQTKGQLERNTFVAGLITDATPLTFPENASIDEANFVLNTDGSRQRRKGLVHDPVETVLTFETQYTNTAGGNPPPSMSPQFYHFGDVLRAREWKEVIGMRYSGRWAFNRGGMQRVTDPNYGQVLYNVTSIDQSEHVAATAIGRSLVIARQTILPLLLTQLDNASFDPYDLTLKVRDFWGVPPFGAPSFDEDITTDVGIKPHLYNLCNAGWTWQRINNYLSNGAVRQYPSLNKVSAIGVKDDRSFEPSWVKLTNFGSTRAPFGGYVIDLGKRNTSRVENFPFPGTIQTIAGGWHTALTVEELGGLDGEFAFKVKSVASYAERVWYAGLSSVYPLEHIETSPAVSQMVLFSQVVKSPRDSENCYQVNSPVSDEMSDLLPTDGGFILLPEAIDIMHMEQVGTSLAIFASNGVWAVSGQGEAGFTADAFKVTKVSSVGAQYPSMITSGENSVFFLTKSGLEVVTQNQFGLLEVKNISDGRVNKLLNSISNISREQGQMIYDEVGKRLHILYKSTPHSINDIQKDSELIFDLTLGAFYKNTYPTRGSEYSASPNWTHWGLLGAVRTPNLDQKSYGTGLSLERAVGIKYVIGTTRIVPSTDRFVIDYTFGQHLAEDFKDFGRVDAAAYLVTGYELLGDSMRRKQANYLVVHQQRTEDGFYEDGGALLEKHPSSCIVQAQWDFTNSANSGKWGNPFQTYRYKRLYIPTGPSDTFDYGWEVVTTKNRLRGSGRALSLKFTTEAGKDCHILGWGLDIEGGSNV